MALNDTVERCVSLALYTLVTKYTSVDFIWSRDSDRPSHLSSCCTLAGKLDEILSSKHRNSNSKDKSHIWKTTASYKVYCLGILVFHMKLTRKILWNTHSHKKVIFSNSHSWEKRRVRVPCVLTHPVYTPCNKINSIRVKNVTIFKLYIFSLSKH